MKSILIVLFAAVTLLAADTPTPAPPPAARLNACYAMRGDKSPKAVEAMVKAIDDPKVRSCAMENLRVAGATDALAAALGDTSPEVRALAAAKLAGFDKPSLVGPLVKAAHAPELVVATSAVDSLSTYTDPSARKALADMSRGSDMISLMALERLSRLHDPSALPIARLKIESKDLGQRMGGITVLADLGTKDDLPALRQIVKSDTQPVSTEGRGFGMMPTISIGRAASTAISRIESRDGK